MIQEVCQLLIVMVCMAPKGILPKSELFECADWLILIRVQVLHRLQRMNTSTLLMGTTQYGE